MVANNSSLQKSSNKIKLEDLTSVGSSCSNNDNKKEVKGREASNGAPGCVVTQLLEMAQLLLAHGLILLHKNGGPYFSWNDWQ